MNKYDIFSVYYSSDIDQDELFIEIAYKEVILCQLSKQKDDTVEINFIPLGLFDKYSPLKFNLDIFIDVVMESKNRLLSMK